MANHHDRDLLGLRSEDYRREIAQLRHDSAQVVYALDCALQLVECLIAWIPEGTVLPEGVVTCKYRLDKAMEPIKGRKR